MTAPPCPPSWCTSTTTRSSATARSRRASTGFTRQVSPPRSLGLPACLPLSLYIPLAACFVWLAGCFAGLSVCGSACMRVCRPVCLSACLPACLPVCLPACLAVSGCSSVCPSVRQTVSLQASAHYSVCVHRIQSVCVAVWLFCLYPYFRVFLLLSISLHPPLLSLFHIGTFIAARTPNMHKLTPCPSPSPKLTTPPPRNASTKPQILPDLILDTPAAPTLLEKFTEQAISDGCLPADYIRPSPPAAETHGSNGVAPPPAPAAGNGTAGASV